MELRILRSSLIGVFVALPHISAASSAINGMEEVFAFIAACIGVSLCFLLSLIYLLVKKRSRVFTYIVLGFNTVVGLFFLSIHFLFLVATLILNGLVFMKFRRTKP